MQIVSLGKKNFLFFSLFLSILFITLFDIYQTVGAALTTETTIATTKDSEGKVTKEVVTETNNGVKTETNTEGNKAIVKTLGENNAVIKTEVTTEGIKNTVKTFGEDDAVIQKVEKQQEQKQEKKLQKQETKEKDKIKDKEQSKFLLCFLAALAVLSVSAGFIYYNKQKQVNK